MDEAFPQAPFTRDTFRTDTPQPQRSIPPPPPAETVEVSIRTMETDIDAISRGGGLAQGNGVTSTVHIAKPDSMAGETTPPVPGLDTASRKRSLRIVWTIVVVVGAFVLFAVGYYLLPLLFPVT
ncbi:MAG: hypothetical protein A2681_01220 [Candidatus Liptonbacteria bacterium RIFCSPHIGHO2_01_FULL_56_18b]|nr:MAG: hypothetical protein A2681_01220 [Candidatus Liptonbacteria bacterium RIFCSPHIGHO2_01_FULL_56_18b]